MEGGDPWSEYKGYHAPPYQIELWIYDVRDLLAVAAGRASPYAPRPVEIVDLTDQLVLGNPIRPMGLAFDAERGRLFIIWAGADGTQSQYEGAPVVNVFAWQ